MMPIYGEDVALRFDLGRVGSADFSTRGLVMLRRDIK